MVRGRGARVSPGRPLVAVREALGLRVGQHLWTPRQACGAGRGFLNCVHSYAVVWFVVPLVPGFTYSMMIRGYGWISPIE